MPNETTSTAITQSTTTSPRYTSTAAAPGYIGAHLTTTDVTMTSMSHSMVAPSPYAAAAAAASAAAAAAATNIPAFQLFGGMADLSRSTSQQREMGVDMLDSPSQRILIERDVKMEFPTFEGHAEKKRTVEEFVRDFEYALDANRVTKDVDKIVQQ